MDLKETAGRLTTSGARQRPERGPGARGTTARRSAPGLPRRGEASIPPLAGEETIGRTGPSAGARRRRRLSSAAAPGRRCPLRPLGLLLAVLALGVPAGGRPRVLHVNPTADCGIFRSGSGEWSVLPSRVLLSCTDAALVVDAALEAPPGDRIKVAGTKDDDLGIFGGETFEFQVAPPDQPGVYYHFIYSPSGFLYSARKRDAGWDPEGLRLTREVGEGRWHFRLEVPFAAIGSPRPAPGDAWRVNLARNARTDSVQEDTSLSGARDYHRIDQYGTAVFGMAPPEDQSVLLLRLEQLRPLPPDGRRDGTHLLRFAGALPSRTALEWRTDTGEGPRVLSGLRPAGHVLTVPLDILQGRLPMKRGVRTELTLRNLENGHVVLQEEGVVRTDQGIALRLDRFYYTAGDREVRFHCDLAPRMTLTLLQDDRVVLERRQAAGEGSIPFSEFAGAGGLPAAGRYLLTMRSGSLRISRVFFILKGVPDPGPMPAGAELGVSAAPAAGSATGFSFRRRQLLLQGRPVYLLTLSPSHPRNAYLRFPNAANLSYGGFGNVRPGSPRLFELPSGRILRSPRVARLFPPEPEYLERLAAAVRPGRASGPGIHRIVYEGQIPGAVRRPDGSCSYFETDGLLARAYRALKAANPGLLYSLQTDHPESIRSLSRACDVFEVSFYTSSYARNLFARLGEDMARVRREVSPDKPVIFWLGGTIPDRTCRLAEEIRYGVYLSIVNGFSGNIVHMGHGFLPETRTRLWSLLSGIHAEVEAFHGEFAAGQDATGDLEPCRNFLCRATRNPAGEIILVAVNTSALERTFVPPEGYGLEDLLTGAPVPVDPLRRRILFAAYEPRVFRLRRRPSGR